MRFRIAIAVWLVAALTGAADWRQAAAESYPSRRINLIVPFPAGSATDAVTRRLAESIRIETGVTVLVENKPGADGNLAALAVLKAEADGLHRVRHHQLDPGGQHQPVQRDALRSQGGLCAGGRDHDHSDDVGREAGVSSKDRCRIYRLGEVAAKAAFVR